MNRRESIFAILAFGAAAGPFASFAQQQGKVWRIGFLTLVPMVARNADAFRAKLRELGYVEGKNLIVEWRSADGNLDRLPILAADLVQMKVDVICAPGSPAIRAAQKATTSIPIVMIGTGDPIGSGFVVSLARPGGNITGLSSMNSESGPKLLELLLSAKPKLSHVAVLASSTSSSYRTMRQTPDAIGWRKLGFAKAGGLMSYAENSSLRYARAASFVDKILKGAKLGELPVEQATKFELVVNLKTAKALDLTIPQTILVRADDVIR